MGKGVGREPLKRIFWVPPFGVQMKKVPHEG